MLRPVAILLQAHCNGLMRGCLRAAIYNLCAITSIFDELKSRETIVGGEKIDHPILDCPLTTVLGMDARDKQEKENWLVAAWPIWDGPLRLAGKEWITCRCLLISFVNPKAHSRSNQTAPP